MDSFCHSCTAHLNVPEFKGESDIYCKYCTDESGNLKPREVIKVGIAEWFKNWQEGLSDDVAMTRAGHFMKAMPAWADD